MNIKKKLEQQNWIQLATIQIAGAICLPILMIGEQIGRSYEFLHAITAIIIGNILLCILAIITAFMAFRFKQYTICNAQNFFGPSGTKLLGLSMIMSLMGWFAIQLNVISLSIEKTIFLTSNTMPPIIIINLVVGVALIITARFGIAFIKKIATLCMPFFIVVIVIALIKTIQNPLSQTMSANSSYGAISLVIASAIMAVIDLPTYYRFSKTKKDSFISLIVLFVITIPMLEIIGVYIGIHNNGNNILDALTQNQSLFFQLIILLFLILSGCTTNNMNLYSAATTLDYLAPKINVSTRTLFLGCIGTALSCFNMLDNLEPILNALGILLSSMGSVMIINFLMNTSQRNKHKQYFTKNIIAWIIGCMIGFLTFFKYIVLLQFDVINAYIAASIATLLLQYFFED